MGTQTLCTIDLGFEQDLVSARQRARQIAERLGFEPQDQTRFATAVSEIARHAFHASGGGRVEFLLEEDKPPSFLIRVRSHQCPAASGGSKAREEDAITSARRLVEVFRREATAEGNTVVEFGKPLPRDVPRITPDRLARITSELCGIQPENPFEEVRRQNQELIYALDEVRAKQEELTRLNRQLEDTNRELEDTNRGILALYSELDEKAVNLRRSSELKTHFISNMSHEFRTPLNSITTLAQLMLDGVDGKLSPEHEKQAGYIRKAAESLSELVNDLLDLAKIEAGKTVVHPAPFIVEDLFSTLRGLMRPLILDNKAVRLVFEPPESGPELNTDEGKLSQILRNLISNALKFTEQGEVRISARMGGEGATITFSVSDTGCGIAHENQKRIFEEYEQVQGSPQQKTKGTGLGLSLSRKLARLLGGDISLQSEPGRGSTFFLTIPCAYHGPTEITAAPEISRERDPGRLPVLVVEDTQETVFIYEKFLKSSAFQVIPARNLDEARQQLRTFKPHAIILDVLMENEYSWNFLTELKQNDDTKDIPVFVATIIDNQPKALALGATDFAIKPVERKWLLDKLRALPRQEAAKVLIIDDDEISRYLLKGFLAGTMYKIIEAQDGDEGMRRAREEKPSVIFLDLVMPEQDGFTTLERLKADPVTREVPVIVHSSKVITEADRERLGDKPAAILSKQIASREMALENIREGLNRAGVNLTGN